MRYASILFSLIYCVSVQASEIFTTGPVISDFGRHAKVVIDQKIDKQTRFKVAFDVSKGSNEKKPNRSFESLARFINMHVANGVPLENIDLALVVHGQAGQDLMTHKAHRQKVSGDNPSFQLVNALLENNVKIYLCGQSAAYYGIDNKDLIDQVQMALSAMTANALLSQQGYTHNPF